MYVATEALLKEANNEGLILIFEDLPVNILGRIHGRLVFINKLIRHNEVLFRCTLSEEIGHVKYAPFNIYSVDEKYIGRILDNKIESIALKWAVDFLIDTQEFIHLYVQYTECSYEGIVWNLSQYYGVTPEFIMLKEMYLRRKNYASSYLLSGFEPRSGRTWLINSGSKESFI